MRDLLNDPIRLFSDYMHVIGQTNQSDVALENKKLGVINSSAWMSLWSSYFGKMLLPGTEIINIGNDAIQKSFMQAQRNGKPIPPQRNIDLFCQYAQDLYDLAQVDAILISCSTMNRAFKHTSERMQPQGVPVLQIDQALMEKAIFNGERILVIATLQSTVKNTETLLQETAARFKKDIHFSGVCVPEAFQALNAGDVERHNSSIADAIRQKQKSDKIDTIVLAQLSMSIFLFSFPHPINTFGIPVLTSGLAGFERAGDILKQL